MRPDLNIILEKKFLLHYIKLTLIRQITSTGIRKYQELEINDNPSTELKSSNKTADKSDKKSNEFIKLHQINVTKKQTSHDYSSNERIIIDNSSNNSKVNKVSNLKDYKCSNNPSESNSINNKSNSKSKSKDMNDNNHFKAQNDKNKNNLEKKDKVDKKMDKVEKMTAIDENINNFFNCVVEKKSKQKPLETYSDISSTSNIDFSSQKIDKNDEKSLFTKMEKLKTYLEKILGLDIFIELYFKINVLFKLKIGNLH